MTAQPHIIRLRDPWQWVDDDVPANVRASRWFNRPTGLEAGTRIVLVVAVTRAPCCVRLNEQELVGQQRSGAIWESEVGDRLELRNQLQLEFKALETDDAIDRLRTFLAAGKVRLEIYD